MKTSYFFTIFLLVMLVHSGCEKDEILEPEPNLIPLGTTATEEGLSVKIFSTNGFATGYNPVYIEIKDENGKDANVNDIAVFPIMHMTEKSHSAPWGKVNDAAMIKNLHAFYVVFVMPSGEMGSWELQISFDIEGRTHQAVVPVDVILSQNKLVSLTSKADGSRVFVALINPMKPKVGSNEFELGIWKRKSMMEWPAAENLEIMIEPEMPSMDHGSPNNIHPLHKGAGMYRGKVNFTMDGWWVVHVTINENGEHVGDTKFDFEFEDMLSRRIYPFFLFACLMAGESLFAQAPATYEAWLDSLSSSNYISMEILLDEVTIDEKLSHKISGINSVDQLLHGLAEVEMMRRGAFAAEPVMRGLASERYMATIDGMRIYGACTDKMDPVASYVEKNNLDNMNISFGGNDASFGPAIHIKLKKPKFSPVKPAMGLLGLNFSSSDRGFNQLADFNVSNSNLAFRGNFMHRKSGNYRQGGGGIVPFSQFEKTNYSAAIAYRHNANTLFSLDFLGDDAQDIGYPALPMDVAFARARIFSAGVYHIGAEGKGELDAKLYHNFIRHEMDDSKRPDVLMRMDMPGETATTGLNVNKGIQKNDKKLAFALEGYYTRAYAEMTMYPDEGKPMFMLTWPDVKRLGIKPSFSLTWEREKSAFNIGTGVEVAGSRINELGEQQMAIFFDRIENRKLQPLLSARIGNSLNLGEHWNLSSLVSFSERLPAVSEQYGYFIFNIYDGYDYLGNPNLRKEGLTVSQVSVDFTKNLWEIGAEIYRFDFTNYIMGIAEKNFSPMTIGASGVKMYSNIGKAQIMGTELNVKASLSERLRAVNTFAYCHGRDADGDPLPLIPPFKNQLALEYLWNNIKFQPEVVWAAQQNRKSEKFHEAQTPSFLLLHLKAQKFIAVGNGRLSMAAGIENLLDRNYKEHLDWGGIPRHGRNFFFNSTWNF